jgi:hypothetical protein
VTRIAAITRERKTAARGTSAALLGPSFRLLAPAGLPRWFFDRQRLVHTFATSLRGPAEPLTFAGAPVRAVIPTPATTGNVIVTFGVLSYAGTLRITVLSDPSRVPDVAVLTAALRRDWAARPADRRGLGSAAPASVEAEHACAAHAHIVPLCTAAANSAFSHPGIPNGGTVRAALGGG